MKKLTVFMAFVSVFTSLHAQDKDSVVTLPTVTITSQAMVSRALDKSFLQKFPDANDVVWSRLNKEYLAKFIQYDLKHQSLFKKNGFLQYDITYMGTTQLPGEIREQVNSSYDGYSISNVARIRRLDKVFWIINLESVNNYVVVRAEEGDLSEVKRYRKS
jgi:hypothetical protein